MLVFISSLLHFLLTVLVPLLVVVLAAALLVYVLVKAIARASARRTAQKEAARAENARKQEMESAKNAAYEAGRADALSGAAAFQRETPPEPAPAAAGTDSPAAEANKSDEGASDSPTL